MKQSRQMRVKKTFPFGATGTVLTEILNLLGLCEHIHFRVPNFTNAITAQLTLEDEDGYQYYDSTAKAKNANYDLGPLSPNRILAGKTTAKVTLSGVAGGTGGVVIAVFWLKDATDG
jgi:hypothetical protein